MKYTNVKVAEIIVGKFDFDFDYVLSEIDLQSNDNISDKGLASWIDYFETKQEEKECLEQRERENNERLYKESLKTQAELNKNYQELADIQNKYFAGQKLHWLEIVAAENDVSIYEIAKNGNMIESTLYRLIKRNTPFEKISLKTLDGIAKGLDLTAYDFMNKYADRFK